ncbi:hypothetical protein [uncultured Cellulomonas sp.]|uniref:hypothetical protein n=1 Tax=uncultured Cellulomonas sp. TaxID=189682 RepID=UPI0026310EBC|nr:hypothetical protein [uncultured Cellulomonas sp.]
MLTLPSQAEQSAFVASLAPQRLRAFRRATGGNDRRAVELYLIDAELASLMHGTIRGVEVLLRERMHRSLVAAFDDRWYLTLQSQFDLKTKRKIDEAVTLVGRNNAGKVIAQLMFGAWTGLLNAGGPMTGVRNAAIADYETALWSPALRNAFIGSPTRTHVHALAQSLNWARNRINHCEPVVFGFPQQGQGAPGRQQRKSPERVVADARTLLTLLDVDVAAWMTRWHPLDRLMRDPLAQDALPRTSPTIDLLT